MFYINALAHQVFLLLFYFAWKKINIRRLKTPTNELVKKNLIIAMLLGFVFDFFGYFFWLWLYESRNIIEYAVVVLATWIISTPVMMAVYIDIEGLLEKIIFKPMKFNINRKIYFILFFISGIIFSFQGYLRFRDLQNNITPQFFIIMLIAGIIAEESLLGILRVETMFDKILAGKYLVPLTIVIAGFFVGLIWELFNTQFRLWTYYNLPPGDILGIPIYVVGFYGVINYTYYNFCKIYNTSPFLSRGKPI